MSDKPTPPKAANEAFQRDLIWLGQLIEQAQAGRFFGKLVIQMEGGVTTRVVKEQSLMPPHRSSG